MKWIDGFSAKFSGIIIFSIKLYYGNLLCSKCMTKSFVSYLVNEIQAYKYNILMTLQSAIGSTVTVIAGILVCIALRLPYRPSTCTIILCPVLSSLKNFPGGGLFWQLNQSCWKLHEMDRSSLKFFPSSVTWGGGAFLPAEPKLLEIA